MFQVLSKRTNGALEVKVHYSVFVQLDSSFICHAAMKVNYCLSVFFRIEGHTIRKVKRRVKLRNVHQLANILI